ncbi:hypothetical protein Ddye_021251 [Dipteronia dyeriana]|uniref:MULE transposase domain-containing protein n=1 Tax=Dipteronia dyeriana TaxID=168575 RepID=A0AAD9U228_9ROSI|nr:hypothetical protein Ddye_021251 [Dipteronia dyeriana]
MYSVPPKVADHSNIAGPQLDNVFGCQFEMNTGQYNYQYNEMYNDMNNEWNNEPNVGPIHKVDNKVNLHPIDIVANNKEDEELVQTERRARLIHKCSYSAAYIARTSEVQPNVTAADFDNTTIKAHKALDYALSLTYGTHEETFQPLPSFGYMLEQKNLGTITDLQYDEDGKFLYFFMSLGASLRGFQRCMCPVIAFDGTYLKGRFGGKMFVTTAQDGNDQVYPIDFGYDDLENNLSYEWFLDSLKGAFGHIDDLVFIFDRHASIEAGISKVFPYATLLALF